jgi:hypothetical protein
MVPGSYRLTVIRATRAVSSSWVKTLRKSSVNEIVDFSASSGIVITLEIRKNCSIWLENHRLHFV